MVLPPPPPPPPPVHGLAPAMAQTLSRAGPALLPVPSRLVNCNVVLALLAVKVKVRPRSHPVLDAGFTVGLTGNVWLCPAAETSRILFWLPPPGFAARSKETVYGEPAVVANVCVIAPAVNPSISSELFPSEAAHKVPM